MNQPMRCIVSIQYFDIYNNQIRDLIIPNTDSKSNTNKPTVLFDPNHGASITNLTSRIITTIDQALLLLSQCQIQRKTAVSPQSNTVQSRSAAFFDITIKRFSVNQCYSSLLRLVDLYGSEQLLGNTVTKEKQ